MTFSSPESIDFVELLQHSLIHWADRSELVCLPAFPLWNGAASELKITASERAPLKTKGARRAPGNLVAWPALGLHAKPNAFLACIVQGAADLSVGVTDAMLKSMDAPDAKGVYHLRLCAKEILIQAAGIPTADGTRPHWHEGDETQPDSTILWIDILAEGAILHTCHTVKGRHLLGPFRFVFNTRLLLVLEAIIEELQAQATSPATAEVSRAIVNALLEILFLRIYRSLSVEKTRAVVGADAQQIIEQAAPSEPAQLASLSYAIKRSCHFIQGRLSQNLSVKKIADHSFVSPAQLNRLFRAELSQSVMEYVGDQRLEMAKALLVNTTLPIKTVSENVGILNPVYFSRLFREKTGLRPNEFRKRHR